MTHCYEVHHDFDDEPRLIEHTTPSDKQTVLTNTTHRAMARAILEDILDESVEDGGMVDTFIDTFFDCIRASSGSVRHQTVLLYPEAIEQWITKNYQGGIADEQSSHTRASAATSPDDRPSV